MMHRSQAVFVDTGAWFAAFVPSDRDHARADQWLRQNDRPLVTTDYVLDELLTLLLVRGERERALRAGAALLEPHSLRSRWLICTG
ncbi:PIN domain-containing protein [Thiohalocapsa sp. ML1]|jgi:uncharacterized protein|uniref:PIN domain-containing protein n=1 Tax=Thiohalocapsa sp. ML1 TaxID=1431688 RepID=UPI0007323676|nr:PIN domain-containing protein [Thiohalocapsa sp. ML1]